MPTQPIANQPTSPTYNLFLNYHPQLSDVGNAHRFSDSFSDCLRFVPSRGWFLYSQTHWQPASPETMLTLASESLPRLQALLHLASSLPEFVLPASQLDADPSLLNLQNGTLDLRSGELLPHSQEHYLTHLLPYSFDPSASSETWTSFLDCLTGSDLSLQRAVGSTLFGASLESTCYLLTGPGQRAHHLFLTLLRQLLSSSSHHTLSLQPRTLTSALLNHDPLSLPNAPDHPTQPHTTLWLSTPALPHQAILSRPTTSTRPISAGCVSPASVPCRPKILVMPVVV